MNANHDVWEGLSAGKRRLLELLREKKASAENRIQPQGRHDRFSLASWAQQRLWYVDRLVGGTAAYNMTIRWRLRGPLHVGYLRDAFDAVVNRHAILRSVFLEKEGVVHVEVREQSSTPLEFADLSAWSSEEREGKLEAVRMRVCFAKFDLDSGPLIRASLVRVNADEHVLLVAVHHTVFDGASIEILLSELSEVYAANLNQRPHTLNELRIQYADYAAWERAAHLGGESERHLQYWQGRLSGAPPQLELPWERARPPIPTYQGSSIDIEIGTDIREQLLCVARRYRVTLFVLLYTAWVILLRRLSGQDDIVVGIPVSNRVHEELERLIGLFVNAIAVRTVVSGDVRVCDLMAEVDARMLEAYDHQDVPFERVVEALRPERSLTSNPIFQVLFSFNSGKGKGLSLPSTVAVEEREEFQSSILDLSLELQEVAAGIAGVINFSRDLFNKKTVAAWGECFRELLLSIIQDAEQSVMQLRMLPAAQYNKVIREFNGASKKPGQRLLHEFFEQQAVCTPHAVAVICGDEYLTYQQLGMCADKLARKLQSKGIVPGEFVGLYMRRGIKLIVALLGVLKAGGAYLPLDPNYPTARLKFVVGDIKPKVIIVSENLSAGDLSAGDLGAIEELVLDEGDQCHDEVLPPRVASTQRPPRGEDLAYVIYTSGSTGVPKGVGVEHRNASNLICWVQEEFSEEIFQDTLHGTSINFDLSIYEIFATFAMGGCLRIYADAIELGCRRAEITHINTVPSAVDALLEMGAIPPTVVVINVAGEPLRRETVERIFQTTRVQQVCNLYGPSETTTYSTWNRMDRERGFSNDIGRPVRNTNMFILDEYLQPLPVGAIGEIYIGGSGVTRGYVERPQATAERFVAESLTGMAGGRMYRTGDRGRWLESGAVEYIGRRDNQVKINGHRVELGEIEARLQAHPNVRQCAVHVHNDEGTGVLVAYVATYERTPDVGQLRAYLRSQVPGYMIPNEFVVVERFPLTKSGKVDRRELFSARSDLNLSGYKEPEGDVEVAIARVWKEVLNRDAVGRQDNFFDSGGHSLLAIKAIAKLNEIFNVRISLRAIFDAPSVEQLAGKIVALQGGQRKKSN